MTAKTMAEVQLHASIKSFLDKNYPCCDHPGCCGEEEEAWAIIDLMKAAGFGLVADAKAEALEEAADEAETLGIVVINPSSLRARAATVRGEG